MFGLWKKKYIVDTPPVDLHSHLIPGVDDGVQSPEEALEIIEAFSAMGYKKLITTPHIMSDFYNNREADLIEIHKDLCQKIKNAGLEIVLELGAEYYLDDTLNSRMGNPDEVFLTFGNHNYLLFETSFINEPFQLKEFIFKAKSRGYRPVLAHPERYQYLVNNRQLFHDLVDRQVLFQLNINSLNGYYSGSSKKFAEKLIAGKQVHFIGSDCHNTTHLENIRNVITTKNFRDVMALNLLNHTL